MPKTLLFVLTARNRGGLEKRYINYFLFLSAMNKKKYKYHVFINKDLLLEKELNQFEISNNLEVHFYKMTKSGYDRLDRKLHRLCFELKIKKLSQKLNPEIIHFVTTSSLNSMKYFKQVGKKILSVYSSGHIDEVLKLPIFQKTASQGIIYECLTKNIALSVMKRLEVYSSNVYTAPGSFINLSNTEFDFIKKKKQIVWAGSLNYQKGTPLLIDFLPELNENFKEISLVILGKGKLKNKINKEIEYLNLSSRVKILYTDDPKYYFKKSLVFFSFQNNDNYPSQSLLEAMACGCIPIATNTGETYRIVDSSNGFLIERDVSDIVNSLTDILQHKDIAVKCNNSREKILKEHTIEAYHNYLQTIYQI